MQQLWEKGVLAKPSGTSLVTDLVPTPHGMLLLFLLGTAACLFHTPGGNKDGPSLSSAAHPRQKKRETTHVPLENLDSALHTQGATPCPPLPQGLHPACQVLR